MTAKLKVGVLVVLMIASSAAFAASANTTAQIDRSSNVDVVDDTSGLVSLQANTSSGVVQQNDSGALNIDFAQGDATGVNTASTFEVGDTASPTSSYAFNVTNQDSVARDITLSYSDISDTDTDSNIQFQVFNSTGDSIGTDDVADEEGNNAVATDVASGETLYVVLVVDTHGLDDGADLSGTLTISV